MRPEIWNPPIELSAKEEKVAKRVRKAKLFVFLRQIRHQLFDDEFQIELATVFKDSSVGLSPISPAQLALAIILQAYTGVSDDEAIEAIEMDRRWQLMVRAVDVTRANEPEASVTTLIELDLNAQQLTTENIKELHIDRAYLASNLVRNRTENLTIICKAWKVKNGIFFDKNAFFLDWDNY